MGYDEEKKSDGYNCSMIFCTNVIDTISADPGRNGQRYGVNGCFQYLGQTIHL